MPTERARGSQILLSIRDLYARHPETYGLKPWELQSALFVLGCRGALADESQFAAAVEAARQAWPQWGLAA